MTTNGRTRHGNRAKSDDRLGSLYNLGEDIKDSYEAALERAIEQSMALAKFSTSGAADIEVRREGWRQRENAEDRRRANALKANRDRGKLTADHLKILGGFTVKGQEFVLDVIEHLIEDTHNRPAEVQPIAEMLTKESTKIMGASYAESLKFLAERGFQTIDQATPPGQHQQ